MSYIPFVLLSAPEYIAVVLLIFVFFRIRIKGFYPQIIFIAIMLGNVSYATRADDSLIVFSPVIQAILLIIMIWMLFKIQIFYAAIIATAGYASYFIVQFVVFFSVTSAGIVSIEDLNNKSYRGYIIPLITVLLVLLIIWLIRKFDLSIDWIPSNYRAKVMMRGENLLFLSMIIISIVLFTFIYSLLANAHFIFFLFLTFIFIGVYLTLIYLSVRKDKKND